MNRWIDRKIDGYVKISLLIVHFVNSAVLFSHSRQLSVRLELAQGPCSIYISIVDEQCSQHRQMGRQTDRRID